MITLAPRLWVGLGWARLDLGKARNVYVYLYIYTFSVETAENTFDKVVHVKYHFLQRRLMTYLKKK